MQKIYQVDSFSAKPFAGNPAAVCPLDGPVDEGWMQNVAAEMNLSETAFLYKDGDKYNLRWFTPTVEVDLCGHATLASAHILWSEGLTDAEELVFSTSSGDLFARKTSDLIQLNFPSAPVSAADAPEGMLEALGAKATFVGANQNDNLVEVATREELLALTPDFAALGKAPVRGVVVTASGAGGEYDFLSRFFAPAYGIDEDPVTGAAHCITGPYWSEKLGKHELHAYQASARGGEVFVTIAGDRTKLAGHAITVLRGELSSA